VETTTGPLGQGVANAVGMAIAERHMADRFNKGGQSVIDHYTYAICGDGDLMEGVALEAVSLAGHLGLGRLILIYDDNEITIEGKTGITFTENTRAKFDAMNWHVVEVADGNDLKAVEKAIQAARDDVSRPSLIKIRTHIAYGSPNKQDTPDAHGSPLGEDEIKLVKKNSTACPKIKIFTYLTVFWKIRERHLHMGSSTKKPGRRNLQNLSPCIPKMPICLWMPSQDF